MEHRDVFLLESIIEYCDKTASYLKESGTTKDSFLDNPYIQDTCAFYCLQIGELASSLSDKFINSHKEIEWRNIVNLRNIIAHDYGKIDSSLLWNIIEQNIPELKDFCSKTIGME